MNSSPAIAARSGGRAILAEALSDSRRRTLALLDAYVASLGEALPVPYSTQLNPPLWEAGHVGWFQDYWIARSNQRHLGVQADPEHERPKRPAAAGRCAVQLQPRCRMTRAGRCRCPIWRPPCAIWKKG